MEEFKGELGSYAPIKTDDGSTTYYSEAYDEAFHSTSGAVEETLYNYIEGCQIKSRPVQYIFEVGLGLGLGIELTYQELAPIRPFKMISSEIDRALVQRLKQSSPLLGDLEFSTLGDLEVATLKNEKMDLLILIGDLNQTLPKAISKGLVKNVQAIYQDPFSPKKNPDLWDVKWFSLLKEISSEDVMMATYSASVSIRKAMLKAGWSIRNRTGFAHKKSSTIACLNGESDKELLEKLESSSALPFGES